MSKTVEWDRHPIVGELEDFIISQFSTAEKDNLIQRGFKRTECLSDLKVNMTHVANQQIDLYKELIEKLNQLPDSTEPMLTVEEPLWEVE